MNLYLFYSSFELRITTTPVQCQGHSGKAITKPR